jgi:L-iditol 2-dehydrogenase
MLNRGGRICLAAFPREPASIDIAHMVRNNIYLYGIRGEGKSATHRAEALMSQKRFDATRIHTHTFTLDDLPTALHYAGEHIDDAIKVVVTTRNTELARAAVPAEDNQFTESPLEANRWPQIPAGMLDFQLSQFDNP